MSFLSVIMFYQGLDFFQVKSTFLVGFIMASLAAASVIYEREVWSLKRQSPVHFLVMLVTVFPCLLSVVGIL